MIDLVWAVPLFAACVRKCRNGYLFDKNDPRILAGRRATGDTCYCAPSVWFEGLCPTCGRPCPNRVRNIRDAEQTGGNA